MSWIIAYLYCTGFVACGALEFEKPNPSPKWFKWVCVILWPLVVGGAVTTAFVRVLGERIRP